VANAFAVTSGWRYAAMYTAESSRALAVCAAMKPSVAMVSYHVGLMCCV
jgi:hypothetical protein